MSQPVTLVPSHSGSISSGPMSAGMIRLSTGQEVRKVNDSTEHVCMFSVCLMFIGVPIIVAGIIFLSFFTPFGIILMVIGVVASASGAILAILSAILSIFNKGPEVSTSPANYVLNEAPKITIGRTYYNDEYTNDELTNETPQQLSAANLTINNTNEPDSLDLWSNFPEAQNPKAYLNSFGELPKVILSPKPSDSSDIKENKTKNSQKYNKKSKRKLPNIKMGVRRRTESKTELTKESLDEIHTTSSSSSSSSINEQNLNKSKQNDSDMSYNNESIITIENFNLCLNDNSNDDSIEDKMENISLSPKDNSYVNNNNLSNDFEKREILESKANIFL